MIKNPLYISPKEKISTTELLMVRKNIGGLPVVNESNELVGLVLRNVILKTLLEFFQK